MKKGGNEGGKRSNRSSMFVLMGIVLLVAISITLIFTGLLLHYRMGDVIERADTSLFETAELLRHQCDGVTGTYMASISNRMNQVMKMLTIVQSIFVPLTFIAGVYGMNFNPETSPWNMPELNWRYGYLGCLLVMVVVASIQITLLWRRGWFQDWTGTR